MTNNTDSNQEAVRESWKGDMVREVSAAIGVRDFGDGLTPGEIAFLCQAIKEHRANKERCAAQDEVLAAASKAAKLGRADVVHSPSRFETTIKWLP